MWHKVIPALADADIDTTEQLAWLVGQQLPDGSFPAGFGMPAGSASLGELVTQGKQHLEAPWLGFTAFFALAVILSLLVFIGDALREAFDPRG